jgi:hypothetical protein
MARSLEATDAGIKKVERVLTDKSWSRQDLANQVEIDSTKGVSLQTVQKFFSCQPVDRKYFVGICKTLNLDWSAIAEADPEDLPPLPPDRPPLPPNLRSEYRKAIETACQRVWVYQTWLPGIETDGDQICSSQATDIRLLLLSFKEGSPMYGRLQGRKTKVSTAQSNSASSVRAFARGGRLEQVRFNHGHHPAWIAVADSLVFWGPTPVDIDSHSPGFLFHKHSDNSVEGKFWIQQFEIIWKEHSHTFEEERNYNPELLEFS